MCIILYMMFLTSGYGYHAEASKVEEKHQFFYHNKGKRRPSSYQGYQSG